MKNGQKAHIQIYHVTNAHQPSYTDVTHCTNLTVTPPQNLEIVPLPDNYRLTDSITSDLVILICKKRLHI